MDEYLSSADQQLLLDEYKIVESKWRFFQTLRYGLTAFTTTFHITLFGGFNYILNNFHDHKGLSYFTAYALAAIPFLGILGQTASVLLDLRLRQMYFICSHRGAAIEQQLQFPKNPESKSIFIALSLAPRRKFLFLTHTHGTGVMVLAVYVVWIYLFLKIGMEESGNLTEIITVIHRLLTLISF